MPYTADQLLRTCRFSPYRKGMGPTFRLQTWDTYQTRGGKSMLGYRLTMILQTATMPAPGFYVLFEGEDFGCSPMHAIDSDAAIEGIMSFLTLRPGDTDSEYFAEYTPAQLDYCSQHAEALSSCVQARYCDENGNVKR